jgi:phosphomannomutase
VLVARAESGDAVGLERLKAQIVDQLKQSGLAEPSFTASAH